MQVNEPSRGGIPAALPDPPAVLRAIDTYLRVAYAGAKVPTPVQARVDGLRAASEAAAFYLNPAFERSAQGRSTDNVPPRLPLRLGNRLYPHMKLVIDRRPDGAGYLFRADTHDGHIQLPPGSKEHAAFAELVKKNQDLAQEVEAAWAAEGLPTFKTYLREDLARRKK